MALMTPWTESIPDGFADDWKRQEDEAGRAPNWLRYFCEHDQDEETATEHFKKYFYSEAQRKEQDRKKASFNDIRKLTLKLLEIAPNLAASSPGFGDDVTPPALQLGKSGGKFRRPKFALIYNPTGAEDSNFYVCFQPSENINLEIPPDKTTVFELNNDWIRFNQPIKLNEHGELHIQSGDEELRALQEYLNKLDDYAQGNHKYFEDRDRPDGLPIESPIYPKLTHSQVLAEGNPANIPADSHTKDSQIMNINTILFGPPGTGKTYNTLLTALYALNFKNENNARLKKSYDCLVNDEFDELEPSEHEDFKKSFEDQIKNGRIVFTTFHQSYAYEDFIEGIRVRTIDKQICYEIYNGTFKQLARKALFYKAGGFNDQSNDDGSLEKAADFYARTLDTDLKDRCDENQELTPEQKTLIKSIINNDEETQKLINKKSTTETPKFILIIDEINRGNISKILGELITLIEGSKRAGRSDRASVKLPSSRETFTVPDNLYIIGTMNTADRSLATLDVALRRRFDFIEMMPQPDFLHDIEIKGINLKEWFTVLNRNIQIARGREFTIGHAFFDELKEKENQKIENLAHIMRRKIRPLLDEYFFEDWEGIRRVLGDDKGDKSTRFINVKEQGEDKYYDWNHDALMKPEAYRKLDSKNNATDNQTDAER